MVANNPFLFPTLFLILLAAQPLTAAKVTPAKEIILEQLVAQKHFVAHMASGIIASAGFVVGTAGGLALRINDHELKGSLADECLLQAKSLFELSAKVFSLSLDGRRARLLSQQQNESSEDNQSLLLNIKEDSFNSIEEVLTQDAQDEEKFIQSYRTRVNGAIPSTPPQSYCRAKTSRERTKIKRRIALAIKDWTKQIVKNNHPYAKYLVAFKQLDAIPAQVAFLVDGSKEKAVLVAEAKKLAKYLAEEAKKLVGWAQHFAQGLQATDRFEALRDNWILAQAKILTDLLTSYGVSFDDIQKDNFRFAVVQQVRFMMVKSMLRMNDVVGGFIENIESSKVQSDYSDTKTAADDMKNTLATEEMRMNDADIAGCKIRLVD